MSDLEITNSFSDWSSLPSLSASISQYEQKTREVTPDGRGSEEIKKKARTNSAKLLEMNDFFDFEHYEAEPLDVVPGVY